MTPRATGTVTGVLDAFLAGRPIGRLRTDEDLLRFEYARAWVDDAAGFPLSPPLAFRLQENLAPDAWARRCRRFLENLLPEGQALDDVARANGVSKGNVFALLRVLGRESTGALVLLPEGATPADAPGERREIPRAELSARIKARDEEPFTVWDGRVRLSIAGMQDKLAVAREGDRLFLVDGALATTHILKPEPARFPALVVNEAFCLRLARAAGIDAAEATVERVPEPVLNVRRFDRVVTGAGVDRIHVIDACQALDLAASHKYERTLGAGRDVAHVRDGASLPRLFALADASPAPARTRRDLLRRVLFDWLVGNADAHGKNVSFYVGPAGLTLAPAYDLVCVAAYPRIDQALAMAIGDQFDGDAVTREDWLSMADACDLRGALVLRELAATARRVRAGLDGGADLAETPEERAMLGQIRAVVAERCERVRGFTGA